MQGWWKENYHVHVIVQSGTTDGVEEQVALTAKNTQGHIRTMRETFPVEALAVKASHCEGVGANKTTCYIVVEIYGVRPCHTHRSYDVPITSGPFSNCKLFTANWPLCCQWLTTCCLLRASSSCLLQIACRLLKMAVSVDKRML